MDFEKVIFVDKITYCECGLCGFVVKQGQRFIRGHNRRGVSHVGKRNPFYGKHHTEETKQEMRKPKSEEVKKNMSFAHIGKTLSFEHKVAISESIKGSQNPMYNKHHSEEAIQKMRKPKTEEAKRNMSISTKKSFEINGHPREGKHHSKVAKRKLSVAQSNLWQDPEYRRKQLFAMGKGMGIKPNRAEKFILFLLNRMYPGEWKYTGDFSFTVNGKNPDFVNINGQKKIIEFNGTYWHQEDIPGEREAIFAEYGYDTLIIWDKELKNVDRVKFRINRFQRS